MQRRLLSILLFWATLFPSIAPALTTGALGQSMLPACCRRAGAHHCEMSPAFRALLQRQLDGETRVSAQPAPCPYRQRTIAASHLQPLTFRNDSTHAAGAVQGLSAAAQAECLRRISFDRSRQKRGPPSFLS